MNYSSLTLPQLLEQSAARAPQAAALFFTDYRLSYAELQDQVSRAAAMVTSTCPIYTARETAHQWRDAGASLAVVHEKLKPVVEATCAASRGWSISCVRTESGCSIVLFRRR